GSAMNDINRRAFLAASAGAACLAAPALASQPAETPPPAPPRVPLGRTGITTSRLAMGTGVRGGDRQSHQTRMGFERLVAPPRGAPGPPGGAAAPRQSTQPRMGFERLVALFRHASRRGVTFFDLADLYGTHVYFREALRTIPRDRVTILTKLWWRYDGSVEPAAEPYRRRVAASTIERFCHELGTNHLDIVLLHCMTVNNWDRQLAPYMEALTEAKQKKRVRAVGVSCHDLGALNRAAEVPWVDVVLARINPRGSHMDGKPPDVIAALRRIKK